MKTVYMCFATDVIHEGHMNVVKKAKEYGNTIIDVVDVMDNHSENVAENVETAIDPLSSLATFAAFIGGNWLVGTKSTSKLQNKIYKIKNDAYKSEEYKQLEKRVDEYCSNNNIRTRYYDILNKRSIKKIKDPELRKDLSVMQKRISEETTKYSKQILRNHGLVGLATIGVFIASTLLEAKLQTDSSKIARYQARKVLEDPKEFVTYTPEQIKNAKNELAEHPELIKKEKKSKLQSGMFKSIYGILRDKRAYDNDKSAREDNSQKVARPLTKEELIQAEKDKEVIQRTIRIINNEAEKNSENMETAANVIMNTTPILGATVGAATGWILDKFNVLDKFVNNTIEKEGSTDSLKLYKELKKQEIEENCITKVLPGIEFSVEFIEGKVIHIVTIFDDKDDDKIKKIQDIMLNGKGSSCFQKGKGAYSRKDYFDVLAEIDTNFIMIAHQKKTPTSLHKPHANDVMSLGREIFNELVFMDYFDAYEFRNKKNEIYNKIYTIENNMEDKLRFITGSDCHRWEFYPYTEENEKKDFKFTYIKSLATFKGLAMAITDPHRIELENSFFNPNEKYLEKIELQINGETKSIPLSKGINVIIGDNSIGKSLFLNAITNYYKKIPRSVQTGYEKYLEKNNINFINSLPEEDIFIFNGQGEIRAIFDEDGLKPNNYLKRYYPNDISPDKYKNVVLEELHRFYTAIEKKFSYDDDVDKLPKFKIPNEEIHDKSIIFVGDVEKRDTKDIQHLVNILDGIIESIKLLVNNKKLEENDQRPLKSTIEMFNVMKEKYSNLLAQYKVENEKINIYNTFLKSYRTKYNRKITAEQAVFSEYVEQKKTAVEGIVKLLLAQQNLETYSPNISELEIVPECNPVDKYQFVSKLQIDKINNDYILQLIRSVLTKKGKDLDTKKITRSMLKEILKNYPEEEENPLEFYKEKINARLDKDFKIRRTIVENKMDVYEEVSAGFDAQMYFTLLSGEIRDKGIYIIDQPEDHISQKAIKEKVLDQFRRMGQQRQVIMVTHNPQFIVNLDADNVIYLFKNNEKFDVYSGALEYENEEYSILKIVADNIEGGLQTIQGRMKRYEKDI